MKNLALAILIVFVLASAFVAGGHYMPKDCVEYKVYNLLENYDPVTLMERK